MRLTISFIMRRSRPSLPSIWTRRSANSREVDGSCSSRAEIPIGGWDGADDAAVTADAMTDPDYPPADELLRRSSRGV
jgi:hypothetical protein